MELCISVCVLKLLSLIILIALLFSSPSGRAFRSKPADRGFILQTTNLVTFSPPIIVPFHVPLHHYSSYPSFSSHTFIWFSCPPATSRSSSHSVISETVTFPPHLPYPPLSSSASDKSTEFAAAFFEVIFNLFKYNFESLG